MNQRGAEMIWKMFLFSPHIIYIIFVDSFFSIY